MVFFTPSEQRRRNRFIDETLEVARTTLDSPKLLRGLGGPAIASYNYIIDDLLFVPNIVHGEVKLPRDIKKTDKVPILALSPDEVVTMSPVSHLPMPRQISVIEGKMVNWYRGTSDIGDIVTGNAGGLVSVISEIQTQAQRLTIPSRAEACVTSTKSPLGIDAPGIGKENVRYVLSRPTVMLKMQDGVSRVSPHISLHEFRHVEQSVLSPVIKPSGLKNDKYRRELEAYSVSAETEVALVKAGYIPSHGEFFGAEVHVRDGEPYVASSSIHIDCLRIKTNENRNDKYFPNGTLKKQLNEAGLDIAS